MTSVRTALAAAAILMCGIGICGADDFTREILDDYIADLVGLRVMTERHAGNGVIAERLQVGTGTRKTPQVPAGVACV